MVHPHKLDEWGQQDPLEPPEAEDEQMQLDILESLIELLMQKWPRIEQFRTRVEEAVMQFWYDNFSEHFRTFCCDGQNLQAGLYAELSTLNNGARIDRAIQYLNFSSFQDFASKEETRLKKYLLAAGIDIDVIETNTGMYH